MAPCVKHGAIFLPKACHPELAVSGEALCEAWVSGSIKFVFFRILNVITCTKEFYVI